MTFPSPRNARSVYLVTYSQANLKIVPSRTDFATLVKDAFENTGGHNTLVQQWCCCREEHQDGNPHYHVAIKLNTQRRWSSVLSKNTTYKLISLMHQATIMRHGNTAQSPTRKSLPVPTTPTLVELLEQQLLHPKSELLPSQNLMPHLPGKGERHLTLWIFITLS